MDIKKLPRAIDLEESILGQAIGYNGSSELIEILGKENVFFKPEHQEIYNSILIIFEKNISIDLLSVSNELKNRGKLEFIGGQYYLIQLSNKVSGSAKIENHARIVQQMFVKRKAINAGENISKEAYKDVTDIFDLLDNAYRELDNVSDWLFVKKPLKFDSVIERLYESSNNHTPGIPSSLRDLQEKLNGYQNTDLILWGGRPGMGKTALMCSEIKFQAENGYPVGVFSLEMSDKQLAARIAANECGINIENLHKNRLTDFELKLLNDHRKKLEALPIYIYDKSSISPLEMKIQAGKWKRENDIKIIFVDYLQLMRVKSFKGNKEQMIGEISASLKGIAKEFNIPVVALSQLSRAVETRGGSKRPMLSDLRDSGSLEQDADIVMFIYRPEYYNIEKWDDDEGNSTKNQVELNIEKYRNGDPGAVVVGSDLQYMRFYNLTCQDPFFDNLPSQINIVN